ncbi:pentatricopeptide repeat-containing protein At3g09040, mitochondrial-like [Selaginella moellendorffii]|uniref:pentatricopeptide repeat-containing protein At3g09040, mitochondrial-like n=1 Tax=Selaginella moellendorffii TaxID=88036 RepID=UPI000D1CB7C0|nr:pentatricopeptide repeat-containing protein At3g09040, mitochondrial-like [Selaginella moellendorffii]|eukprot:XP_024521304.1 pentatricopeptide repeat-containing protein At3g09040, mitochondrial-like [Selaginella moellendorffii]
MPVQSPAAPSIEMYRRMERLGLRPNASLVLAALRECGRLKHLHTGREIHRSLQSQSHDSGVASSLVEMYVRCGSMADARCVFEGMLETSTALWNLIIGGYVDSGEAEVALEIFARMLRGGEAGDRAPKANHVTYLAALKACVRLAEEEQGALVTGKTAIIKSQSLARGRIIHSHARSSGLDTHSFVASRLVSMYSKCGSMNDARQVFESMVERDSVSWNCIILGYAECGDGELALEFFSQMLQQKQGGENLKTTSVTYLAALKACASLASGETPQLVDGQLLKPKTLESVKKVHSQATADGHASEVFVATSLVDVYCKCGSLREARLVFDTVPNPTLISWTTIILGHADNHEGELALELYERMLERGFTPNYVTYVAALKACSSLADKEAAVPVEGKVVKLGALAKGREIHRHACQSFCAQLHIFVANSLVDMYAKCGSLEESRTVFESIPNKSVVSWTGMILGYAENGDGKTGLELYKRMQEEGCAADAIAVVAAAKACSSMAAKEEARMVEGRRIKSKSLEKAKEIYLQAREHVELDSSVGASLVDMFAKCGSTTDAREVFERMPRREVASWNCLIMGHAESGEAKIALEQYQRMIEDDRVVADGVTYVAALKACACLNGGKDGDDSLEVKLQASKTIHARAVRAGFELHALVANTLIDTYAKAGSMSDSWRVFESMESQSAVSWTAIVSGYARAADGKLALESYRLMVEELDGVKLDAASFIAALKACRAEAAVESGRTIEAQARAAAASLIPTVANCLIDFYGKCGSMVEARQVFDSMNSSDRQLITWNSLIDGYSRQGDFDRVLELFEEMQRQLFEPNDVTFVSILAAASHAGLVDRGKECFESMSSRHGIVPGVKHYACMVDLLGRANRLDEALETASSMPYTSNSVVWMALLSACHKWKNVRIGQVAFESLLKVERNPVAACVLMSNLYAGVGMWEESRAVKEMRVT